MSKDMDTIEFYCQVKVCGMVANETRLVTRRDNWQLREQEIIKVLATSIAEQTRMLLEEES